eukprot:m.214839 g.214839  ORF g.214839 m.214839 type:complete len:451 (-) comp15536_c0_seq2:87-1439(-)
MDSTQSGPAVGTGVSSSNDTPDDWMRVLVVHDVSLKVVLFQSGRLTNSTSTLQLLQREYVDCCDGSESCLNKENIENVLRDVLYRRPTKREVDEIFEWLDTDKDGLVDPAEWRSARWRSEIEFLAGTVRAGTIAFLGIVMRVLPRIPVIKFFRPRAQLQTYHEALPSASYMSGVTARIMFTTGSIFAATVAFLSHRHARDILDGGNDVFDIDVPHGSSLSHFIGGGVGGALHAVVMAGFTAMSKIVHTTNLEIFTCPYNRAQQARDAIDKFRRRLPGMVIKDVVGFALFFGVFHSVQRTVENAIFEIRTKNGEALTQRPSIEAIGVAAVSGATAGFAYHTVSHPMERAQALSPHGASVRQLLATGRVTGPLNLFRKFFRNGGLIQSILIGTVTFASYDAAIRLTGGPGATASSFAQMAPPTTRDAMIAIESQRMLIDKYQGLAKTLQKDL